MPIANKLLGFRASFVMLILGAAGAWCIHGILLLLCLLFHQINCTAARVTAPTVKCKQVYGTFQWEQLLGLLD